MDDQVKARCSNRSGRNKVTAIDSSSNTANLLLVNLVAIAAILLASAATLSVALAA